MGGPTIPTWLAGLLLVAALMLAGCAHQAEFTAWVRNETPESAELMLVVRDPDSGAEMFNQTLTVMPGVDTESRSIVLEGGRYQFVASADDDSATTLLGVDSSTSRWQITLKDDAIEQWLVTT